MLFCTDTKLVKIIISVADILADPIIGTPLLTLNLSVKPAESSELDLNLINMHALHKALYVLKHLSYGYAIYVTLLVM